MGAAFRIGRFFGIDVKVHWTFFLLLAWVAGGQWMAGGNLAAMLANVLLVLAVFVCVVAHEYGHALAAKRYGIDTQDITLLPIGGVARLRDMPAEPFREFVVAVAGPAVNVVIAFALALGLFGLGFPLIPEAVSIGGPETVSFWQNLLYVNVFLVLFNAIPAFPMDGGRVLRALLASQMSRVRATDIAAGVGQTLAVGFGLLGLLANPLLILIAIFVYFGARAEAQHVRYATYLGDLPVRAAMIARFLTVPADAKLDAARERLLQTTQQDFPVIDWNDRPVGMLYRSNVIEALQEGGESREIEAVMSPLEPIAISPSLPLKEGMRQMQEHGVTTLPVVNGDALVGILTQENIVELMLFREGDPEFASPLAKTVEPATWIDR